MLSSTRAILAVMLLGNGCRFGLRLILRQRMLMLVMGVLVVVEVSVLSLPIVVIVLSVVICVPSHRPTTAF